MPPFIVIGSGPVVITAMVLQFMILLFALFLVYKIWSSVITYLKDADDAKAKWLANMLGKGEVGGKIGKTSFKAIGSGLGVTTVILGIAVLAMIVIGNHTVK
jgi:hypothetical protein